MSVWSDVNALCSWAGVTPANNESANKKKSTRISDGGHYLKPLLVQCALAAIKNDYFRAKYENIRRRRGHKKAIIAIAHKMLIDIYHLEFPGILLTVASNDPRKFKGRWKSQIVPIHPYIFPLIFSTTFISINSSI